MKWAKVVKKRETKRVKRIWCWLPYEFDGMIYWWQYLTLYQDRIGYYPWYTYRVEE